ncbi:BZ3501_MvSof-1269-A2-R1_Chr1-3g02114 [Microbotryum saponariae]|nr:BZ3501_MvSof-1269-A2-R1_Chr1-3g02114 [Microbotryum saponariae]
MATRIIALGVVLASLASSVLSATQSHPLYHRFQPQRGPSPAGFSEEWYQRGVVHVDTEAETAWFDDSSSLSGDGSTSKWWRIEQVPFPQGVQERVVYQVAVGEDQATVISVDSVRSAPTIRLSLHSQACRDKQEIQRVLVLDILGDELLSTRYETNTIHEGCLWKEGRGEWVRGPGHDGPSMEVTIQRPVRPEGPVFKPVDPDEHIVVGEDGKIVPPPPEKGFLAKYWMYILPVVVLLMMGGPDEQTGPPGTAGAK